jgi:hypothetical protein
MVEKSPFSQGEVNMPLIDRDIWTGELITE